MELGRRKERNRREFMEGLELICFKIISAVGTARSMYIEAITLAKQGKINEAKQQIEEGEVIFAGGHAEHAKIITNEANGIKTEINLLLMHAEDQLMSAETLRIIASEFIDVYAALQELRGEGA